jgi:hypothetical protein
MSFEKMMKSLASAYDSHVQGVRWKHLAGDSGTVVGSKSLDHLKIPVVSGMSGIGKTACIKKFASDKHFEWVGLDASSMPVSTLATLMFVAIHRIRHQQISGCVLHIDNINEADAKWLELLNQYGNNTFDALVNREDAAEGIGQERQHFNRLPESLFVVGEQWTE